MNLNLIISATLFLSSLILLYNIFLSIKEYKNFRTKKIRFYKSTIYYETDLDKNYKKIKVQKRIIIKLKIKLFILKCFKRLGVLKWQ